MSESTRRPDTELAERVRAVVVRTLEVPAEKLVDGAGSLHGVGLGTDSIDALRLLAALEEEFEITIDESQLDPSCFERLDTIIGLVRSLTDDGPGSSPT
jgi:acyl carrier protein